jgi:sodium-coupled neutral amino acid transporter 11
MSAALLFIALVSASALDQCEDVENVEHVSFIQLRAQSNKRVVWLASNAHAAHAVDPAALWILGLTLGGTVTLVLCAVFLYVQTCGAARWSGASDTEPILPGHGPNEPSLDRRQSMAIPREAPVQAASRGPSALTRRRTIAHGQEARWRIEDAAEMSSIAFVLNMFADLCPPGMLPMAFALRQTGYVPAMCLLVFFCGVCVFTMWCIGRTTAITSETTFEGQWRVAISQSTSWIPVAVVVAVCFGCLLSYACFYADIFASAVPAFGLHWSRGVCLFVFGLFPTLPLCLLKDMSALSPSSGFALVAVLGTAVVMVVRCFDGSYAAGGRFFKEQPAARAQVQGGHLWNFGIGSLVLVNALAMGFLSHYNGCKYYRELAHHTPAKLWECTAKAMGLSSLVFAICAFAGYSTFGDSSDGVILNNYAEDDQVINVARIGMGLSIIASFPLMFSGLREAVLTLFERAGADLDRVWQQDLLSVMMLLVILAIALFLTDAGLVVGVVGAVCGSSIIYVIPSVLYAGAIEKFLSPDKHRTELTTLHCLAAGGVILGVSGVLTSILS